MANSKIDHIVYCVKDLEEGIDHIANLLGVRPVFGGYHKNQGTKNAILNLGNQVYLEILAVDNENTVFSNNRWMGVDLIDMPKITRWAIKRDNLESGSKVLSNYNSDLGVLQNGQRKMTNGDLLQWNMSLPSAHPEVEVMPFLLNWNGTATHPADTLPEECQLQKISFYHPVPETIQPHFELLSISETVQLGNEPMITLHIKCPNGVVLLQ